jgi:HPt (histidine-containing phosphotransfer) domain-containing protein
MNLQLLADTLEFDLEDVQMLMDMFISDSIESLQGIEVTINSNDFQQMKNIAHGIKGSASNLMLDDISNIALEIEQLAKINQDADYKSLFQKLKIELTSLQNTEVSI